MGIYQLGVKEKWLTHFGLEAKAMLKSFLVVKRDPCVIEVFNFIVFSASKICMHTFKLHSSLTKDMVEIA